MVPSSREEVLAVDEALRQLALEEAPPARQEGVQGVLLCWRRPSPRVSQATDQLLAPRGVLLLLHGAGRGPEDFFVWSEGLLAGQGLSEEVRLAQTAVSRGWLVLAVSITGCSRRAWEPSADGPALARAVPCFLEREGLRGVALAALGAPGAEHMVLLLHRWLPGIQAVVAQVAALPGPLLDTLEQQLPATLFVHMPLQDPQTACMVQQVVTELRHRGVPTAALPCSPRRLNEEFLLRRLPGARPGVAAELVAALGSGGLLDAAGFLLEDPRTSSWRDAVSHLAGSLRDSLAAGESPLARALDLAWALRGITAEWADECLEWCETAGRFAHHWAVLEEGREALVPWTDHSLRRARVFGPLLPAEAAALPLPPERTEDSVLVAYGEGGEGQLALVNVRALVPWQGYLWSVTTDSSCFERRPPGATSEVDRDCHVHLWRGEMSMEGLFSQLFWAMGCLEHAEAAVARPADARFLIDWTDRPLAAAGEFPCANVWNAFFEQPWRPRACDDGLRAKVAARYRRCNGLQTAYLRELWAHSISSGWNASASAMAAAAEGAEQEGRLYATTAFGPPYFEKLGRFALAQPRRDGRGGRLDDELVAKGRSVLVRWLRMRPHVLDAVQAFFDQQMASRATAWLAVHVRLTDRGEGNAWPEEFLIEQVIRFVKALGCDGVLICSDDVAVKAKLARNLRWRGLVVAEYAARLSHRGLPAHKDRALDRHGNSLDMLTESLLMAQCKALLGTWSNVSAAVVWMAPDGFRHFLFGDAAPGEVFEALD